MDKNQNIEDELQKAIDDITNNVASESPSAVITDNNQPEIIKKEDTSDVAMSDDSLPNVNDATDVADTTDNVVIAGTQPGVVSVVNVDIEDIKKKALQELAPILGKMNINPEQKFKIYCDMMESLDDKSVIPAAYDAAAQMTDETAKGEALLKIIDFIDKE